MIYNKDLDEREFLKKVVKITPEEFIALSQLLDVKMSEVDTETGKYALRDAEKVLEDCVNVFRKLPHKARKVILKAMTTRRANNGASTEDTTNE